MKSLWNEDEARLWHGDLPLRVYSSRLLGKEPSLVLHGGGNTSVKTTVKNLFGESEDILYVKGSGWDLETIEQAGFSPVRLNVLKKMAILEYLTDSDMVKAQRAAINKIYPGHHWNEPYQAAVEVITSGLKDLGLLLGRLDTLIEEEAYKRFYMHRIGHWIGMDVHDPSEYKTNETWRILRPGMVMTVEPGLYIPAAEDIPEEWWNIGVRIEDDVLVTENGHDILTAGLPKTVWEIESFLAGRENDDTYLAREDWDDEDPDIY